MEILIVFIIASLKFLIKAIKSMPTSVTGIACANQIWHLSVVILKH